MALGNRVVAIVVGVAVVVAVVAAVLAARRPTAQFQPGTPERTVQDYIGALLEGDTDRAAGYLSSDSECDVQDLDAVRMADSPRVLLVDRQVEGDSARVNVDVTFSSGDPFDASDYRESHTLRLSRSGQDWRLTGAPWPLYDCLEGPP